jgi:hypothetical protein
MKLDDILATLNESILPHSNGDKQLAAKVLKEIQAAAAEEKEERAAAKGPKLKNAFSVLLNDPENVLQGRSFSGWIVQMPEETPQALALDKARAAGHAFNQSKKGRKNPVKTLGEVFADCPRKFWKTDTDTKTVPKTKVQILIQPTDGSLGQPASF